MLIEYHTREMLTATERFFWNALKFGTTREVNSKEGEAIAKGLLVAPRNCSEAVAPQVELNGTISEALILKSALQCQRTKLLFEILFNDDRLYIDIDGHLSDLSDWIF